MYQRFTMAKPGRKSLSKTQQTKRRRRKYPNVFFKKELTAIFDNIDIPKVMVGAYLTFFCALRISETCKLKWADVDLEEKRLKVVEGKNYKDGFVPISSICIPILKRWKLMNPKSKYVFPSDHSYGEHYTPSSLFKEFKKAIEKAGLSRRTEKTASGTWQHQYKFHTLRHSRCTHLLSNGVPIERVQKFMRHDKIDTTLTYTWILDKELNKMVEQVDNGNFNSLPEENKFNNIQRVIVKEPENPMKIIQKRLAIGEINLREYNKLMKTLSPVKMEIIKENYVSPVCIG